MAWLAEHLPDPDVVLLQVDGDALSYYARHLPSEQLLDDGGLFRPVDDLD